MPEKVMDRIKKYRLFIIVQIVFGFITYFVMISGQLTNQLDPFWAGKNYAPGAFELSEGRFIWCLLSPLLFHMQLDAYTTLLALLFFALGLAVLHNIFFRDQAPQPVFYIASAIFLTTVGVRSQLSYRFQSPFFGLAFLCSMLSAWLMIRLSNYVLSVLAGALLLMIAMGSYQVDLGCTLLVLLMVFLTMIYRNDKSENITFAIKCILSGLLGLILYFVILKISLLAGHVEMTARVGSGGLSITGMLKSFPKNCLRCFAYMYKHFFDGMWHENMLQDHLLLFGGIFLLFFVGSLIPVYDMIKERRLAAAVLFLALHLLIPVFSCCFLFLGTDVNMNIQTTIAVGMIIPLYLIMLWSLLPFSLSQSDEGSSPETCRDAFALPWRHTASAKASASLLVRQIYKLLLAVWAIVILYGNFFAVQVDQQAMMEGTQAVASMADDMLEDLALSGYFDIPKEERKPVAVMGSAVRNGQFKVSPVFYKANIYARMGDFEYDCERVSWESAFRELCYRDVQFVTLSEYFELQKRAEIKDMPQFPARGYLKELEDVVVLKVSD